MVSGTGDWSVIVIVTKFSEGAWLVIIVIPALYLLMYAIRHHYSEIAAQLAVSDRLRLQSERGIIAVVPVDTLNALAQRALRTACILSRRIHNPEEIIAVLIPSAYRDALVLQFLAQPASHNFAKHPVTEGRKSNSDN
jgi:hypothetical protein